MTHQIVLIRKDNYQQKRTKERANTKYMYKSPHKYWRRTGLSFYKSRKRKEKGGQAVHRRQYKDEITKDLLYIATTPSISRSEEHEIPLNDRTNNASFQRDFTKTIHPYVSQPLYLGRNSVTIERFGGRVTAPMKRTTFG